MSEKQVGFTNGAARDMGAELVAREPSHIHVPRPSRVARIDDVIRTTGGASMADEGYRCSAPMDGTSATAATR